MFLAGVAIGVRLLLDPVLGTRLPYVLATAAVVIAAATGGWGPGLAALAVAGLGVKYLFVPPRGTLLPNGEENLVGLVLFEAVSLILIALAAMQRSTRIRLREALLARQEAEGRERLHRQKLQITLASIGDGVIATDTAGRVTFINRAAQELTGWPQADALGQPIETVFEIRSEDDGSAVENPALRALRDGRVVGLANHTVLIARDGRRLPIDDSGAPIVDAAGVPIGAILVFRDVSEARARQAQLKQTAADAEEGRRTLEALMEFLPEGLAIADAPDGRVRMVSRYGRELMGRPLPAASNGDVSSAWALCRTDGSLAGPEELPLARAVAQGEVITEEEWLLERPESGPVAIVCSAAPIRDAQGRITGGLMAWRDVSQRKRLEEKLRETAKLESLGILAGGIAHDFNNLLTGVLGYASLLMDEAPRGTATRSFAEGICQAAERAAKLTQQMLAYSGRGQFVIERLDFSEHVRQLVPLLQSSIPKQVELKLDLAAGLPPVEADPSQIQQVVMNLVINGAEAIDSSGGLVTVTTRARMLDAETKQRLSPDGEAAPGPYVMLEVSDNGRGMDGSILPRIFDPFFTTKFQGRGLGLAAVQGIVRGHHGFLSVDSVSGRGTTFRVFFPAAAPAEARLPAVSQDGFPAHGGRTVLVVDDEAVVRRIAATALRRLGYQVLMADDGAEALQLFRTHGRPDWLVLLDVTMPGLSGEETLRELRRLDPAVRVIVSSGFSEAESLRRFEGLEVAGFLQKPYTAAALTRLIGREDPSESTDSQGVGS